MSNLAGCSLNRAIETTAQSTNSTASWDMNTTYLRMAPALLRDAW